jgi:opacity protein-like surface antigen
MNARLLAGALLGLGITAAQAVAVVDFNGIDIHSTVGLGPNGYSIKVNEPYTEDGYRLTSNFGYKIPVGLQAVTDRSPWWTGSPALFNGWGPSAEYINATHLSRVDGASFNLLAMDAAGFSNGQSLGVYGFKQGTGAVVSQNFLLDNSPTSLQALTLSADFQGLAWAAIYAWNARIDNIQLSSPADGPVGNVPEPQSLLLALTGVGAALWARRRRT